VRAANRAVRDRTGPLWVRGEVSGWKRARSGHCFFTLKDAQAELCCTLWASRARQLPMLPEDGMQIEVLGQLGVYERRGELRLEVTRVETTGAGGLWQLAKERLIQQLRAEGLLDEQRKRQLPPYPARVGIVTSGQSAALHDMYRVLRRRAWWVPVLVSHCGVEGADAAPEIACAIQRFGRTRQNCPVDVVIVARGGGSMESLWGFNMEPVARAIAGCPVPVISAVGHETDYTIADLVADMRAATPTAGAERAVPDGQDVLRQVSTFLEEAQVRILRAGSRREEHVAAAGEVLNLSFSRRLALMETSLGSAARHLEAHSPRRLLARTEERTLAAEEGLNTAMQRRLRLLGAELERQAEGIAESAECRLDRLEQVLAAEAGALDARSPLRVLARGYALVSDKQSGATLRSARDAAPGQEIRVRMTDGSLTARVEAVEPDA
jgi:exodeoxyribonuclease VII large subunit